MKQKITNALVKGCTWKGQNLIIRDTDLPGFFLSVGKQKKSFKVQFDIVSKGCRRSIRRTIGDAANLDPESARKEAAQIIRNFNEISQPKQSAVEQATLAEFLEGVVKKERLRSGKKHLSEQVRRLRRWMPEYACLPLHKLTDGKVDEMLSSVVANFGRNTGHSAIRLLFFLREHDQDGALSHLDLDRLQLTLDGARSGYSSQNILNLEALPDWFRRLENLPNPFRRGMHLFGLYSGLRPSLLTRLEKSWFKPSAHAILVPSWATHNGRSFVCFLSVEQEAILRDVLQLQAGFKVTSKLLFPPKPWSNRQTYAITRERTMPGLTGSVLRNTYREAALHAQVSEEVTKVLTGGVANLKNPSIRSLVQKEKLQGAQKRTSDLITEYLSGK